MTSRIITKAQAHDMANQLASMGGTPEGELGGVEVVPPALRTRVCVSGSAEAFADGASRWLGYRPAVERVDLRSVGQAF